MSITTVNPATGEPISTYAAMGRDEVWRRVETARRAFPEWRSDLEKRRGCVYNLVEHLRANRDSLAGVATREMGKVAKEAAGEIEKCAWTLEFYADHAASFLHEEVLNTDARKSFLVFEPIGVIGAIMPWNFPYWQVLRFAAPTLMAGNTIVIKPSSVSVQCGIEMERAFAESGFPDGAFQVVVGGADTANHLIDSGVGAVAFTGSTGAGSKVARRASANLKKCVLELGGSDPFIVLEDADVEKAADGAVKGRFINCGQSCIASKRFFVAKKIADEFVERFIKKASDIAVGDPTSQQSDMGPLASAGGLETISGIVDDASSKGAEILLGGKRMDGPGYFYEPTILEGVAPQMRIAGEETFGPVAPITIVDGPDEAVRLANKVEFGLGASIWSADLGMAEDLSRRIEAGIVSVNNVVVSDPRIPFGGIKNSGFGRELSRYGMLEFINIKSVRFYDSLVHHHFVE